MPDIAFHTKDRSPVTEQDRGQLYFHSRKKGHDQKKPSTICQVVISVMKENQAGKEDVEQ